MLIFEHHHPLPVDALVVANSEDVLTLNSALRDAPAVLLYFPKWTDGRAYSQAVLLRTRLGYAGEIRATGDVLADMLPLLRRCGFSAAQLRADQSALTASATLDAFAAGFPGTYQGDAAGAAPRFAGSVQAPALAVA